MTEIHPRVTTAPAPETIPLQERWEAAFETIAGSRLLPWASLIAVVGLAAFLNLWNLETNGYGNTFYAAAVRSMTLSWKNFFFGSFDPGGFITVDKPPVFLWVGALSARIFGYSTMAIIAPSAVAGMGSVALIWLIVRRYAGLLAATVAGVALALTPISVAVDRLNLPEPFYILALVVAAFAVMRSLESRRWLLWTILAGLMVGVAFNTKMLAAWIPGPALALALVVGDGNRWRANVRRILARLAVLAVVTFIVSASWMLIVDAWPASSRPYIGGSTDNTVYNLAFDYNGFGRVQGEGIGGGARPGGARNFVGRGSNNGRFNFGNPPGGGNPGGAGGFPGGNFGGQSSPPRAGSGGAPRPGGNATGAGGIIAGSPGWLRMFDDANGGQIGWLLPFALMGAAMSLWYWRKDRTRRALVVLFAGWVLLFGGVFSYAQGIYHSYYTSALAPGIAALTGLTVVAGVGLIRQHRAWLIAIGTAVVITLLVQFQIAGRFPGFEDWSHPWAIVLVVLGAATLAASALFSKRTIMALGMTVVVAGLVIVPASWSSFEMANASTNTTLPQAGPREGAAGRTFGSAAFDDGTASLAAWLQKQRQPGVRWDLAVTSSQNASTLIAEYQLSVMAIGGFSGSDPTITASQFGDMVNAGEIRYVLVQGGFGGAFGGITRRNPVNPFSFGQSGSTAPGTSQAPGFNRPPSTNGQPGNTGANGIPSFGTGANGPSPFAGRTPSAAGGTSQVSQAKGAQAVMSAVQSACKAVTDSSLPAQYQGSLYDCAGAGNAIKTAA